MNVVIVTDWQDSYAGRTGQPIAGPAAAELTKMLHEAGLRYTECMILNAYPGVPRNFKNPEADLYVKNTQLNRVPSDRFEQGINRLRETLDRVSPSVVYCLGDAALWAVTGERGIGKWRGSLLDQSTLGGHRFTVVPSYSPEAILRKWDWRAVAVQDFRRGSRYINRPAEEPAYHFTVRPSFDQAINGLARLIRMADATPNLRLSVDIETRNGHIACIGFGWSRLNALCIPLMCVENPEGYWSAEEELMIVEAIIKLLHHPNVRVIGQNFLYDLQYLARHWGIAPIPYLDTMIAHAVAFPGTPKGLDYLSSMYCEYHRYWKDESKDWDPKVGEDQLWIYNCKDCVVTYEVAEVIEGVLDQLNLTVQCQFEMDLVEPLLMMMLRGVRVDTKLRSNMMWELQEAMGLREQYFEDLIPDPGTAKSKTAKVWYRSPQQLQKLFYEIFKQPVIRQRKTGRPTVDDGALAKIGKREPLLYPLTSVLSEYRSLGVFLSTFIQAPLDHDHRMRCSYNPVGTETFRFNSSADAFGFGTNLQNIPKGDEE